MAIGRLALRSVLGFGIGHFRVFGALSLPICCFVLCGVLALRCMTLSGTLFFACWRFLDPGGLDCTLLARGKQNTVSSCAYCFVSLVV